MENKGAYHSATMLRNSNIPCDFCKKIKDAILDVKVWGYIPPSPSTEMHHLNYYCLECFDNTDKIYEERMKNGKS